MRNQGHENLTELLTRFMDAPTAEATYKDIEAGEQLLDACPAPLPDAGLLAVIRAQMAVAALRKHRIIRLVHGSLAAAAAVIVLALIGLLGPGSTEPSGVSYAAILPTALWESEDITADDRDLAYFSSEISQIEAQMQALNGDESEVGVGAPEELEMELMAIQAEFLKG
jgi:hypothetical protein